MLFICILACDESPQVGEIGLEKSEKIIGYIDQLNIRSLILNDQNLIINDTLVLLNPDSLKNPMFHQHQMSLAEWESEKGVPKSTLTKVLTLMNESSNKKIVKERNAYFFSEGGWIDSEYGKIYSRQRLEGKEKEFGFDRVQEIKPFGGRMNWYVYYAD